MSGETYGDQKPDEHGEQPNPRPTPVPAAFACAAKSNGIFEMGALEFKAYRTAWKLSHRREQDGRTGYDAQGERETFETPDASSVPGSDKRASSFEKLRESMHDLDEEDPEPAPRASGHRKSLSPARVAANLLLGRLFDQHPKVIRELTSETPVVIVEIADRDLFLLVKASWAVTLRLAGLRIRSGPSIKERDERKDFDLVEYISPDALAPRERPEAELVAMHAIQMALPVLAFSPNPEATLPKILVEVATHRLTMLPLDAAMIAKIIRIVTGKICRELLADDLVAVIGLRDLMLAVRFDRSPGECLARLVKLASSKLARKGSRDLTLDQLHGLDEAVAWAKSTIRDLEAWKRGELNWEAIDAGVCIDGPSGVGKTTLAKVFASEANIAFFDVTLARWQSSGEGHLGHLLRAMKSDFDAARAMAATKPVAFFIDEVDSFADRSKIKHSYRDYAVNVVNALLAEMDGLSGKQGLIFVAATNDVTRCDPAILRAGRLNRIIRVGLPTAADLEKMLRVRLQGALQQEDLSEIATIALGATGADIERIVKDARRFARHDGHELSLSDLKRAVAPDKDLPEALRRRAAAHEAGHIIMEVLINGPDDVQATIVPIGKSAGSVTRWNRVPSAGTYDEFAKMLQILLAGRIAEKCLMGAWGQGSGGSDDSDLAIATRVGAMMIGSVGLSGPHPLLYLTPGNDLQPVLAAGYLRAAINDELKKAEVECTGTLSLHIASLREVSERLLARPVIRGTEVADVLLKNAPEEAGYGNQITSPVNTTTVQPADAGDGEEFSNRRLPERGF